VLVETRRTPKLMTIPVKGQYLRTRRRYRSRDIHRETHFMASRGAPMARHASIRSNQLLRSGNIFTVMSEVNSGSCRNGEGPPTSSSEAAAAKLGRKKRRDDEAGREIDTNSRFPDSCNPPQLNFESGGTIIAHDAATASPLRR